MFLSWIDYDYDVAFDDAAAADLDDTTLTGYDFFFFFFLPYLTFIEAFSSLKILSKASSSSHLLNVYLMTLILFL